MNPRKEVRAYLLLSGMTVADFADRHGFNVRSVAGVIDRYWNKPRFKPRGKITTAILDRLRIYASGVNCTGESGERQG